LKDIRIKEEAVMKQCIELNCKCKKFFLYLIFVPIVVIVLSGLLNAEELTIGLIPEQNVFKQIKRYRPLGKYIEEKTGVKIKFTVLSRYGNIIESFNEKKIEGAFWGSFTGAMAIKQLGIQPIARPVNPDGNSSYKGYIFVHKFSVIDGVDRMKNTVIAFVDRATTAGYIFPLAYFREHGVKNINKYFKEYYFTGSHDAAIYAVLNKEADVGCAKNTIFDLLARENPQVKENLVILAESTAVPSNGLGLKRSVPLAVRENIRNVLLNMDKDPVGREVLAEFGASRFIKTTEKDYKSVFDIAASAGIALGKYRYVNK
jgi:phosphonate transport system substrate-binding protein